MVVCEFAQFATIASGQVATMMRKVTVAVEHFILKWSPVAFSYSIKASPALIGITKSMFAAEDNCDWEHRQFINCDASTTFNHLRVFRGSK
jgi:hypothetical protein